jgi:hypothetical protein
MGYPWFTTLQLGVAGMLRNQWPDKIGIGGRFAPEWVAGMVRNTHSSFVTDSLCSIWLEKLLSAD